MTQLTGEVTAGPGGGSQTATITPGTSGQIAMSNATPAFTWTTESGDCTISATGAQTCTKVNGVTIGGTPAAGNQPVATSSTSSTWSALNLAGGSGFVTGVLPAANQASQTLGGDLSGTTAAATVIGLRGDTLPAPTGTNTALEWSGSALQWVSPSSPISVSGTGLVHVTSGTVDSTAYLGTAGQFAVTNSGATGTAWATCSGDVSCSTSVPGDFTVNDIHGASVPAAGALTTGNGPYVSGVSALTYSALNLGGGSGWVTGTLPAANQAAQTMAGDVTGTTATSVVAQVHGATIPTAGALTTGNGPYVSGASALTYSALNLAGGPSWVTGDLPVTNIAAGSNGQVLTTVSGAPAWATPGTGGVSISGTPTAGNQPVATSGTAAVWEALNLAGGSAYVTGVLPAVNQAFQTLAGDAVGVANANVVSSVGGGQVAFNGGSLETWNVAASPSITQVSDGSHVQGQSFTITPQWSTVAGNQGSGNIIFPFEAATGIATESHLQTTRGGSISGGVVSGGVLTTQLGGLSDIPGYAGLFLGNVATTSQNAAISNQGADTWVNALNGEAVILSINASAQSAQTATAFTAGPNLVVASDGSSSLGGCVGCLEINKANTVPTSVSTKGVLLSEESDGLHAYNFGSGFSDQIISPAWQSASFSGSQSGFDYLFSNTATDTTSATLVTILTIPLPNSGTSVDCEVRAVARLRGSTPSSAAFGYQDLFINTGGTVTGQTGGANNIYSANLGLTTGAVSFVISGTNILVQVQDLLSANVDWTAHASCHYS